MTTSWTCTKCGIVLGWATREKAPLLEKMKYHRDHCGSVYSWPSLLQGEKEMAKTEASASDLQARYDALLKAAHTFSEAFRTHGAGAGSQAAAQELIKFLGHVNPTLPPRTMNQTTGQPT